MKRFITLLALSMLFTCGIANAQGIVSVGNSASTSKNAQNSATASGQGALRIADRPTGSFAVSAGVGVNNWGPALVADGDYTFVNFGGGLSLSAGLYGAFGISTGTSTYSNHTDIYVYAGPEISCHWAILEQLDVFTKTIMGYCYYSAPYYSVNMFAFGAYLGATYYINKSIGFGGVIGVGIPTFAAQVTFRL